MIDTTADTTDTRPLITDFSFLPRRGPFTFPDPYGTRGIRLTNPDDGPLEPVGYSYWRNINAHQGGNLWMFLVFNRNKGGRGPVLVDVAQGQVQGMRQLFPDDHPLTWATGEGWSWSAIGKHVLYLPWDHRFYAYDVVTQDFSELFRIDEDKILWQCHVSDDGQTVSATVKQKSDWQAISTVVWTHGNLKYVDKRGELDESQIDKSGRYLVIKDNLDGQHGEDNLIFDLDRNDDGFLLLDEDGAAGHSDLGYGYMVQEDNFHAKPSAMVVRSLASPRESTLCYHLTQWEGGLGHISHSNARDASPSEQFVIVSNACRTNHARINEIVKVPLDGSLRCQVLAPNLVDLSRVPTGDEEYRNKPKANVCPLGQYAIWTANAGQDGLSAFLLELP